MRINNAFCVSASASPYSSFPSPLPQDSPFQTCKFGILWKQRLMLSSRLTPFPLNSRRTTFICAAANQEAEEAFKKTVEIDRLIDLLREANTQLQKLVVENILAFNPTFWIRLAARSDTCKSEDDKRDYEELATTIMTVVDRVVHKTKVAIPLHSAGHCSKEKIESSTDVLKAVLKSKTCC